MKELKVGERVTITLEAVEHDTCEGWIKEHLKEDNPPLNDSHINRFTPKKTS